MFFIALRIAVLGNEGQGAGLIEFFLSLTLLLISFTLYLFFSFSVSFSLWFSVLEVSSVSSECCTAASIMPWNFFSGISGNLLVQFKKFYLISMSFVDLSYNFLFLFFIGLIISSSSCSSMHLSDVSIFFICLTALLISTLFLKWLLVGSGIN